MSGMIWRNEKLLAVEDQPVPRELTPNRHIDRSKPNVCGTEIIGILPHSPLHRLYVACQVERRPVLEPHNGIFVSG